MLFLCLNDRRSVLIYWIDVFTILRPNVKSSLCSESPPERTGRRRSMPGSSDKSTPSMEPTSTAATPFRVTVSTVSLSLFSFFLPLLWLSKSTLQTHPSWLQEPRRRRRGGIYSLKAPWRAYV
uniref:DAB2 interacting protein b n=1 Tax=Haplochromis burtoni TaxID=8153 RepID=A0A3Q2WMI6_HAPBU